MHLRVGLVLGLSGIPWDRAADLSVLHARSGAELRVPLEWVKASGVLPWKGHRNASRAAPPELPPASEPNKWSASAPKAWCRVDNSAFNVTVRRRRKGCSSTARHDVSVATESYPHMRSNAYDDPPHPFI